MDHKVKSEPKQRKDAENNQHSNATEAITIEEISDEIPGAYKSEPIVEFPDQFPDEDSKHVDTEDQSTGYSPTVSSPETDAPGSSTKVSPPSETKEHSHLQITSDTIDNKPPPEEIKTQQQTSGGLEGLEELKATMDDNGCIPGVAGSASPGGVPKSLRTCYICGQLYGSKSIKIHEPQCLEKWRVKNEALPEHMRAPEPVKPANDSSSDENEDGSNPELNPAVQSAFQNHLDNLVTCSHCSRTFSPDRIQKHEASCIEKPKYRVCITPKEDKKPK